MARNTKFKRDSTTSRRVLKWNSPEPPGQIVRRRTTNDRPVKLRSYAPTRVQTSGARPALFRLVSPLLILALIVAGLYYSVRYFQRSGSKERTSIELRSDFTVSPLLPELTPRPFGTLVHTVLRGETLGTIVDRYGFDRTTAHNLGQALADLKEPEGANNLQIGQQLLFVVDAYGIKEVKIDTDPVHRLRLKRNRENLYVPRITKLHKQDREQVVIGSITSSFAAAAADAGVEYDIVDELVDLFSDRVNFHQDFQKGDRFTVIFRNETLEDGTVVNSGPILAAALEVDGKRLVAVRYVGTDGKARHFDESGQLLGETFLRFPVKFSRISSYFTTARFHPILKFKRPHNGVDFAAPLGTPVRAVANGRIEIAGRQGGSGIMIKISHNARFSTAYLHLSKIESGVRVGSTVTRGQVIGAVGKTGLATGPHLHYAFYDRGQYTNPLTVKLPTVETLTNGLKVSVRYLRRVLFTLEHYQAIDREALYKLSPS